MPLKKRTIAGGLLLVGAVLGTFMSGLLPGFGSGTGIRAQSAGDDSTRAGQNLPDEKPQESAPVETSPITDAKVNTPVVLEIRIDNHDYIVPDDGSATGVRTVDLDEVVKLAQATTGNDDGIRVRILRTGSARLTAWTTLHDSLVKAGLSLDSIRMPKDLVE
jgi:hypothetical protein